MAKKYAIWNKKDPIFTAEGKMYTAEEWLDKHPVARQESVVALCSASEINGALFATLGRTMQKLENEGADFSGCTTDEERLDAIHAFLDEQRAREEEAAEDFRAREAMQADSLASIAASLEYQSLMQAAEV